MSVIKTAKVPIEVHTIVTGYVGRVRDDFGYCGHRSKPKSAAELACMVSMAQHGSNEGSMSARTFISVAQHHPPVHILHVRLTL